MSRSMHFGGIRPVLKNTDAGCPVLSGMVPFASRSMTAAAAASVCGLAGIDTEIRGCMVMLPAAVHHLGNLLPQGEPGQRRPGFS